MIPTDKPTERVAIALAQNDDKWRSTPFFMLPKTIQAVFRSDAVAAITAMRSVAQEPVADDAEWLRNRADELVDGSDAAKRLERIANRLQAKAPDHAK